MTDSRFVYVTYIRTTPDKVWRALMDPEFTRKFWFGSSIDSPWTPGASWKLQTPDGRTTDSGEVLEIDPEKRLVVTWRHELFPEMKEDVDARLTYELEQAGESVKLTVIHQIARPDSKLIEGVSGGWPHILSSLKTMLETGDSLVETRAFPG